MMKKTLLASAIAATFLLQGCATSSIVEKEGERTFLKSKNASDHALKSLQKDMKSKKVDERVYWQDDVPILNVKKIPYKESLPDLFDREVIINEPFATNVDALLLKMSKTTGINIIIEDDVFSPEEDDETSSSSTESSNPTFDDFGSDSEGSSLSASFSSSNLFSDDETTVNKSKKVSLTHDGSVKDMLNAFTSKIGAKWRYEKNQNRVVIYKLETRIIYIPSIPGGYSLGAAVAGSNSSNSASFETTQNVWSSILEDIGKMVSAQGTFTLSESSGLLTVRDNEINLDRIEKYIDLVKEGMRSQILIDVKVYSVSQVRNNVKEMDLALAFKEAGLGANITGATGSVVTGAASLIIGIDEDVPAAQREGLAGSRSVLNILEQFGDTSVLASNTIRTVNNQPSALTTIDKESFLEKKLLVVDPETGRETFDLEVGEESTGLSMHILPTLDENGKDMLLQISFTLSRLNGYNTYDTGDGSQVNVPIINSSDFVEKVWLRSGQTLVLSGFDKSKTSKNQSGMASKDIWQLGGSHSTKIETEKLVVVITPAAYNAVTSNRLK